MYFPELHKGPHWLRKGLGEFVYVGWLDDGHVFQTGETQTVLREKIHELCRNPVLRTRGFHICTLCPRAHNANARWEAFGTSQQGLGSAEIHVKAADGSIFLSPNLLHHYMEAHQYLPPACFLEAVARLCM
jgi:hypothetical protein